MSLEEVWVAASANHVYPVISKDSQFFVASTLLVAGILLTGFFGLNRSLSNVALCGVPASLAFGFGAVFMICAVGVYV